MLMLVLCDPRELLLLPIMLLLPLLWIGGGRGECGFGARWWESWAGAGECGMGGGGGRGWYLRARASGWLGRVNGDLGPGPVYFGLAFMGEDRIAGSDPPY